MAFENTIKQVDRLLKDTFNDVPAEVLYSFNTIGLLPTHMLLHILVDRDDNSYLEYKTKIDKRLEYCLNLV